MDSTTLKQTGEIQNTLSEGTVNTARMSVSQEKEEAVGHSRKLRSESALHSGVTIKKDKGMDKSLKLSDEPAYSDVRSKTDRPPSPAPSCVSMKSDGSMFQPPTFNSGPAQSETQSKAHRPPSPVASCVSMKRDRSMYEPPTNSGGPAKYKPQSEAHRPPSPVPSCVSMKSAGSMIKPLNFSSGPAQSEPQSEAHRPPSPALSCESMNSDGSMSEPPSISSGPAQSEPQTGVLHCELRPDLTQDQSRCGVCEKVLRDPVITTCGHSFCRQCSSNYWEQPGLQGDQACPQCGKTRRIQPPLQPLLDENTADEVLRRVIEKHKASLKRRFENISEDIIKPGAETLLNKIYTELYITEGESEGVNKEHEVWQVESASRAQTTEDTPIKCNDIFKPLPGQKKHIRTVMTKGVAGIGKTVSVQKFILDWIDGVANQDVHFMFPLPFRELNLVRDDQYSLQKFLLDFHPELKELKDGEEYKDCQVVFIFDGLDESRLPLNFQQNMISDLKQTSSVHVLMTSLIQGTLLHSAQIWITSRPAAASQIPAQCIDRVTEVRGFNDPQKEEYFKKRISDESQADRIISHIKAFRILHIMCHIPVFCWIAATVLQQMLEQDNTQEIPRSLTEMFIHFLLIQTTRKNQKYQSGIQTNQEQLQESQKEIILKLAKLAFIHLEKGNLMFYEEDLKECDIDVSEASVYSGMFSEIFREESVFHQRKVYCFVHLSIQEFLAALHVFIACSCLMKSIGTLMSLEELLKLAVTKVLESRNGHLDLFLRFLMGISLESNQRLLQGLLKDITSSSKSIKEMCQYIKEINKEDLSPERCISLLQCLSEVNDHSIHEEIQEYLKSPKGSKKELSPAHCSALAHMLLMSEEVLDEFDLKTYNTSDEGRRRMIPALRSFRTAKLDGCKLNKMSCETVKRSLQSASSLILLDLSCNALGDSGVQILSAGLTSPHCKLQTLRLAECSLTDKSCEMVATVLQSRNSLTELDLSDNDLGDSGVQLLSNGLSSPHCKLQTLRFCNCQISNEGYVCLALTLMLNPSCVKYLDVSNNYPGESAQKLLSSRFEDPPHKVEALQLAECTLTDKSCGIVATVLQSPNSLTELDLSNNDLGDSGFQLLSDGLFSPHCKLQTLRIAECTFTDKSCGIVATVLQSPNNSLTELDLSNNALQDYGIQLLSNGLFNLKCKLQTLRIAECTLTNKSCGILAAVLQSPNNSLTELDLSNNDLGDSGLQPLSNGLSSSNCKLQTLRLSDCLISEKGCICLASALSSNPSHLKELDLRYNYPGESGLKLLSVRLEDPVCKLERLKTDHASVSRARPRLLRYACELTLNPNTAHRHLSLSEGNRKVTRVSKDQPYPDHPERFDYWYQVLCREGLSGRCYWEAEWSGRGVYISVAYKSIQRKGGSGESTLGCNDKSWRLYRYPHSYSARHNKEHTVIPDPYSLSSRVGVYLDWLAGTLSFYSVSPDTLTHLHTFHSTFTEPLYPGFGFYFMNSSVSLC